MDYILTRPFVGVGAAKPFFMRKLTKFFVSKSFALHCILIYIIEKAELKHINFFFFCKLLMMTFDFIHTK